jgi:tetratricopeptide (TPR) repeat protein
VTAASLMAAATLVFPAKTTFERARGQALPSTQHLAREFIQGTLAQPGLVFAMESYTPGLPIDQRAWFMRQETFARLSAEQQDTLLGERIFDVFHIPFYAINAELAAFYYDLRHFLAADVIVTSGAVRGRFEQNARSFPRQMSFYRDLERYMRLLRVFRAGDQARGPEIRLYRFTPEGRERLIRDRGMLEPGFYEPFRPTLHAPHLHAFLADVAWRAYNKKMYGLADLYYQALEETKASEPDRLFQSPHVVAKLELGQIEQARQLCEDALARDPHDLQAMALMGLVHESQGEWDLATVAYRRCIAAGEEAAAADVKPDPGAFFDGPRWAREQLEALGARSGE